MTTITTKVHNFLQRHPVITRYLDKGIINSKALAELIDDEEKLDGAYHGIISAIRRFDIPEQRQGMKEIEKVLKQSKISTKSRLVYITLSRDFAFLSEAFPKILAAIKPDLGEVLRISEGRKSFKILVDQANKDKVLKSIKKEYVLDVAEDLAEINIQFGEGFDKVRGIRATILNEISINNIDIEETVGCLPEFMIMLKEKDIGKAHDALLTFFYK